MYAVRMENICKEFPGILANDHITFEVEKQTIHCLLGENGSGKSTLMNVLFGLYKKESGNIFVNEEAVEIDGPAKAEKLGIGMVHQHFMLIPQLTVLENIILGSEPGKVIIDRKTARKQITEIIENYHFNIDLDKRVRDIPVGMKQRVEIIKLLYRGADIIIFDEPTAVLTPQETEELFAIFRNLIDKGCTIIFITHKLNEIFAVSDRVSVLSKGKCIGTVETKDIDAKKLSEMMVGRQIAEITELPGVSVGEEVLSVENVRLLPNSEEPVTFAVRKGEIVGIAGIDGNGQMELEELICGIRHTKEGTIRMCGRDVTTLSVKKRKELGLAYIPSDRLVSGALAQASVKENFLLGYQDIKRYKKNAFIQFGNLKEDLQKATEYYEIKLVDQEQAFSGLSGGNQQKVVLAREVSKDGEFVFAAQPIRGLDIGAIEYVHKSLMELRSEGRGILVISAELSELLEICDRIVVLCDGMISARYDRAEFNENRIGLAMIGKKEETDEEHT